MGNKVVRFEKAKTAKDLLMATYDALAIHRWLGKYRHILHCDMSKNNVLTYPELNTEFLNAVNVSKRPTFIQRILATESSIIASDAKGGNIARAIGIGLLVNNAGSCQYYRMPEPSGTAKKRYIGTYGQEMYEGFCDTHSTVRGRAIRERHQFGILAGVFSSIARRHLRMPYTLVFISSLQCFTRCWSRFNLNAGNLRSVEGPEDSRGVVCIDPEEMEEPRCDCELWRSSKKLVTIASL
ncbi:hypothetical protein ABKN59_008695 [Abortiporus biennis]